MSQARMRHTEAFITTYPTCCDVASALVGDDSVREHILNENFLFSNMLLHAPAFRLCKNIFLCVSFSLSKNCFRNFIIVISRSHNYSN